MEMEELRKIIQDEEISCKQDEAALALVLGDKELSVLLKGQMANVVKILIQAMMDMPNVKTCILMAASAFMKEE